MMSSTYLDAAAEGERGGARFGGGLSDNWMSSMDAAAMPFSGLDASYEASPQTSLQSPETPSLDNTVFPSPMADFAYLDRPFGDFSSSGYAIPPATPGQFPVRSSHRTSTSLSDGYDLTGGSSASPSLAPVWPAHVSPAATFLPTPPMADELSAAESGAEDDNPDRDEDEEEEEEEEPAPKKRKRGADKTKGAKRPHTQLRTASRAPKKRGAAATKPRHPSETVEEVKARAAHNQVEQQYRKRLNTHFERLLAVLPPPGREGGVASDRRVSKAEVLDLARERIRALERQTARLERERRELRGRIGGLEGRMGGRCLV
ncbi:hypothetical protein CDV31_004146 [Fusarium ambrosium]|uniref:BHLH domain-containing protein n=1 Tax=Fusarium ambrosium TaxID=131363 RepID=A0A428US24_9HYPO|nr:hypothetical protein CDV31_004146 [Fusarium ambrosium]